MVSLVQRYSIIFEITLSFPGRIILTSYLKNIPFCQILNYKESFTKFYRKQVDLLDTTQLSPQSYFSVMPSGNVVADQDLDMYLCSDMFDEEFDFTVVDQSSVATSVITDIFKNSPGKHPHNIFGKKFEKKMIKTRTIPPEKMMAEFPLSNMGTPRLQSPDNENSYNEK